MVDHREDAVASVTQSLTIVLTVQADLVDKHNRLAILFHTDPCRDHGLNFATVPSEQPLPDSSF